MAQQICLRVEDYEVGWISALPIELSAAIGMLDRKHHALPQDPTDTTVYTLGNIGEHNVVMACLPVGQTGTNSAATIATRMRTRYPAMRFVLLVGVGGGVPSAQADIRLGDVVISQPSMGRGGVIQYDLGKSTPGGFTRTGFLNAPPEILLSALATYQATQFAYGGGLTSHPLRFDCSSTFLPDRPSPDILFEGTYSHAGGPTCNSCDQTRLLKRPPRELQEPRVYYGTIGSGNQVIRDGVTRDRLSSALGGVLCFEMEAAGIMNNLPCLVVRGICDYADDHKTKSWQPYAASSAAAYAKELLYVVPPASNSVDGINDTGKSKIKKSSTSLTRSMESPECAIVEAGYFAAHGLLSNYEPDRVWDQYQRKRCPGTTKWILDCEEFRSWIERNGPSCLWLTGKIGSGKTLLTSTVVEMLLQSSPHGKDLVAHFFYTHSNPSRLKASDLFESYIKQILNHMDDLGISKTPGIASSLRRYYGSKVSPPSFDEIIDNVFIPLHEDILSITYIVDGLDECKTEEVNNVLKAFRKLLRFQNIRVFISGRESLNVMHSVPGSSAICISNADVRQDIREFIDWRIEEKMCERILTENESLLQDIKFTLIEKADRMILWVNLQIENLWEDCLSDADLRAALTDLPKDLDETFERCLQRISTHYSTFAPKILYWVCAAITPFTVTQLREALAIDPHTSMIDQDRMLPPQDILRSCFNLITLDSEYNVLLAHHSVRQYLLARPAHAVLFPNGFNPRDGEIELGQLCIAHLCSPAYGLALQCADESRGTVLQLDPAAISVLTISGFPSLLRRKPKPVQLRLPPRINRAASSQTVPSFFHFARSQWAPLTSKIARTDDIWSKFRTLALEPSVLWRLHPWPPLGQSLDSHYCGLLGWAIANSHIPMLDLLLSSQAPNVRRDIFQMPLQYYEELFPLHLAAKIGDGTAFKLLLKRCDLKKKDSRGWTVLHHAASSGSSEVMAVLINNKVKVEVPDRDGMTALHIAATNGHEAVVQTLLENGINVNLQNKNGWTALHCAADNGHEAVVQTLLKNGINVNLQDKDGRTALHFAAHIGHEAVVQTLLKNGINVNLQDKDERTALHQAAYNGHEVVVQTLLENGIDVNLQDKDGWTALHLAAHAGHEVVVQTLLENGIDVNLQDKKGWTALHQAAYNGHEVVVQTLLKNGIDVNLQDKNEWTALHFAAHNGHEAVVQTLPENGINVNLQNKNGWTALHCAAHKGHEAVVQTLLKNGINMNLQNKNGWTALHCAAHNGHEVVVHTLLENGIDVNLQNKNG